jgi:hypothetical protein
MAISLIGGSTAAASTITIPGTYQNGDLLLIFAFNNASTTLPTLPAGWTSAGGNGANVCACRIGWKVAGSASETSGTWTNASSLACIVYRGVATNKTPIGAVANGNGSSATLSFTTPAMKARGTSWVAGFAGHVSATNVATAPAGMTLECGTGVTSLGGSDTNGPTANFPTTTLGVNASAGWETFTAEIMAEQGFSNGYQFAKVGDGMGTSEKIR